MDTIIRLAVICAISAVLAVFISKSNPEMGITLSLCLCTVVLLTLIVPMGEIVDLLEQMMAWTGMQEDVFTPLLKTLGLALICRVGGDLCRDAGQSAMASLVEIGAAFGAVLISVPLLKAVWELLQSLI